MKLNQATKTIESILGGADRLVRHRWANKNYVEFTYIDGEFSVVIFLRPIDQFRAVNSIGIHTKVESQYELIYQLGNAIEVADRDMFSAIHVYCLESDFVNRVNETKELGL